MTFYLECRYVYLLYLLLCSQLQGVLSDYPVTSIDIHHSKRSMVTFGLVESYKVTLNSTEPLRDTILSSTWQFLNSSRAIWFRSISSVTGSFGVLGFKPAGEYLVFVHVVKSNVFVLYPISYIDFV